MYTSTCQLQPEVLSIHSLPDEAQNKARPSKSAEFVHRGFPLEFSRRSLRVVPPLQLALRGSLEQPHKDVGAADNQLLQWEWNVSHAFSNILGVGPPPPSPLPYSNKHSWVTAKFL